MSQPASNPESTDTGSTEDLYSALFLDLVAQHAEMAMMFLGRVPHPQTGKPVRDLETARLFISQLEMLEARTRGNLNQREQALLKQALMTTRLAFVESAEAQPAKPDSDKESGAVPATPSEPSAPPATPTPAEAAAQDQENPPATADDERKKFVKKY
jgi:hypothetical protein